MRVPISSGMVWVNMLMGLRQSRTVSDIVSEFERELDSNPGLFLTTHLMLTGQCRHMTFSKISAILNFLTHSLGLSREGPSGTEFTSESESHWHAGHLAYIACGGWEQFREGELGGTLKELSSFFQCGASGRSCEQEIHREESNELEILKLRNTFQPKSEHIILLHKSSQTQSIRWAVLPRMISLSRGQLFGKVAQIRWGVIKSVAYLHRFCISHGDIKPKTSL